MRLDRSVRLPALLIVLVAGEARSRSADTAAEAVLKEKGLTKVSRTYVIEAETPALAKMKEVRAAFAVYVDLTDRRSSAEQAAAYLAQLDEQKTQLQSNLDQLTLQIDQQGNPQANNPGQPGGANARQQQGNTSPLVIQRDQLRVALNAIDREQKTLKAQSPQAKGKGTADEEASKAGEAFKAALAEMRPLVDEVTKKYAELEADEAVKSAMIAVKKASIAKLKLGPSDAFLATVKELDLAERRFLGKKTTVVAKKKAKSKR